MHRSRIFIAAIAALSLSSLAGAQQLLLTAAPTSADLRATPTLSWSGVPSTAVCAAAGGWSGTKASSGVAVPAAEITRTTRYTLNCSWPAVAGGNGTATVTWTPPTTNTDGTPLTNLARYNVVYGTAANALAATKAVTAPASSTDITGLTSATWYFAVVSENTDGVMSAQSNIASKVVTASGGSPAGFSSAYLDVVIRPAPLPPTNVAVSVAVTAGATLTPVYRVLGKAGAFYPGEMFGLVPTGRECGDKVFKYRGLNFRRVAVQPSEAWPASTSVENLAAPCA